jgi:tripartite-type tricarboxylate transporter receptor subunit TctC
VKHFFRILFFITLVFSCATSARAQNTSYPNMPIRLVIPFAPGGSTDILGRKLAVRLSVVLGQTVIVDNRAGAAGMIGCAEVARAKPDGYTLLLGTTGTHAINPFTMTQPSYDSVKDFAPVALIGTQPFSIAVHPSVPAQNLMELTALVKANPGKYSYASAGTGGIAHLTAELFKSLAGKLDITHIPYKGGGPALQDVLAGRVQIFSDSFSTTYPQHKSGSLRVLAMTAVSRSKSAQDIPTAIESGYPDLISATAGILLAPVATPKAVVDLLSKAVDKVMMNPAFLAELEAISVDPAINYGPEKTAQFIRAEMAKWSPVVKSTNTKME